MGKFVAEHVATSVTWDEALARPGWGPPEADISGESYRWLLDELDGIEAHLSPAGATTGACAAQTAGRPPAAADPDSGYDLDRGADVVVRVLGQRGAHLLQRRRASGWMSARSRCCTPELLDALNDHPGIGLVLGAGGSAACHRHVARARSRLTAERLPPGLAEPEQSVADLARLLSFPHAGDLVVIGAWNAHGRVVTFEDQTATHGGVGGPQDYPFFLTPPSSRLDVTHVTNASQIYPYFIATYHN